MCRPIHKSIAWAKAKLNDLGRTNRNPRLVIHKTKCPVCGGRAEYAEVNRDIYLACRTCEAVFRYNGVQFLAYKALDLSIKDETVFYKMVNQLINTYTGGSRR